MGIFVRSSPPRGMLLVLAFLIVAIFSSLSQGRGIGTQITTSGTDPKQVREFMYRPASSSAIFRSLLLKNLLRKEMQEEEQEDITPEEELMEYKQEFDAERRRRQPLLAHPLLRGKRVLPSIMRWRDNWH